MAIRLRGALLSAAVLCAAVPALAAGQGAAPPAPPAPPPAPGVVAQGVSIAEVPVGGLTAAAAKQAVIAQHVAPRRVPLLVTFRGRRLVVNPVKAGYVADVDYAVQAAMLFGRSRPVPSTGVVVPLREKVNTARLRAIIAARARKYDLAPRDAALTFSGAKPVVRKPRVGIVVDRPAALKALAPAIVARDRAAYALPSKRVAPAVTSVGAAVIIERDRFRLTVWRAGHTHSYPIAVGQPAYPTPSGLYRIVTKQTNPTWFPPDSPWAAGLGPVPPGVDNPLGTRWMGTSAPGIGIHGTPISGSIGTRASHGCIRMYIGDAERVYDQVEIGTPVLIR
jgi:lipoprotein-anchoring transpeptidase ErfK/SrfK